MLLCSTASCGVNCVSSAGLTSFSSIAGKQATLEGPAVSTVKKAVKLYQVCPTVASSWTEYASCNDVVSAADYDRACCL